MQQDVQGMQVHAALAALKSGRQACVTGEVVRSQACRARNDMPGCQAGQGVQATQQERIKVLSQKLRERLEPYVRGDRASFLQAFRQEAEELSHATFGYEMLHVIGWGACPVT